MRPSYATAEPPSSPRLALLVLLGAFGALALPACSSSDGDDHAITIGVFLSYTGYLSANSINSERALLMAFDTANRAGGVGGRPLRLVARDTGSDPGKAMVRARELVDEGAAMIIGPDTSDLAVAARGVLFDRTVILPSLATSSDILYKSPSWFVIGASIVRVACELATQLRADGRQNPLVIVNPSGYNSGLAWTLTNSYGLPKFVLGTNEVPTATTVAPITASNADAFVLAAFPPSATSLVYALLATGAFSDPTRWYLSPTLHSPVFLQSLPKGGLAGARGVAQGSNAEGADFRERFAAAWDDSPLDDAYPFYDAGALAVLSLQHALTQLGAIPDGRLLSEHIIAVTRPGGTPIHWNELPQGLELLRQGVPITYLGLSGKLEFDTLGHSAGAVTNWWTIGPDGFADRDGQSDCHQ
jgi:ABC-type branched-subunit amino acid transport system substrate-binding protein